MTTPNTESTGLAVQKPAAVVETAATAMAASEKAAIEARYLVALRNPRNDDDVRVRLLKRCESPRFAELAEYSKPVGGGKKATGGSIRLMEECARQYGNIEVRSSVVFDDAERRIIKVTATDLESNYPASLDVILEKTVERKSPRQGDEVLGSRINSKGEKVYRIVADEDAFIVKQGAAVAKARRECIRAIVPGDLVEEALERCAATRKSEVKRDPSAARKRLADAFYVIGVMPQQLADYLEKPDLEAVTDAELEVLRAIYTAMKEGETTWKEVMAEKHPEGEKPEASVTAKGTEGLKARLGAKKNGKAGGDGAAESRKDADAIAGVTPPPHQSADPDMEKEYERQRLLDDEQGRS